jgi:hypothetical protein
MKRSLIAVSLAVLASTSLAASQTEFSGAPDFDRSLPTYPEVGNAGLIQLAGRYSIDAGESTFDAVVQDYGSA